MRNRKNLLVALMLLLAIVYCAIEAMGNGDLYIYLCAARDLGQDIDIYAKTYIDEQYHYYYALWFALLLKPFCVLPFYGVKLCWLLLNMSMFVHLLWLLANAGQVKELQGNRYRWFLLCTFIFSLRFLHENIHASQITILILWCTVMALRRIWQGKDLAGAVYLSVAISIKLLPLIFIPYLLYRGYFRTLFYTIVCLLGLYLLPSLFIGHQQNVALLQSWWHLVNPVQPQHNLDVDERSFHALSTLLATLLIEKVPDMYAMPLRRNIANLSYQQFASVLLFARLLLLSATLFYLRGKWLRPARSASAMCLEVAYLLLIIPLIFPHQQHYAFLFICPAFCLVVYDRMQRWNDMATWKRRSFLALIVFIYLCANLKILLGEFNRYYEHYKILTYGALLLIPLLANSKVKSEMKGQK